MTKKKYHTNLQEKISSLKSRRRIADAARFLSDVIPESEVCRHYPRALCSLSIRNLDHIPLKNGYQEMRLLVSSLSSPVIVHPIYDYGDFHFTSSKESILFSLDSLVTYFDDALQISDSDVMIEIKGDRVGDEFSVLDLSVFRLETPSCSNGDASPMNNDDE